MVNETIQSDTAPSLYRRLAAAFYDAIALAAIWFFATLAIVLILKGEAIHPGNPFFMFYLLATAYAYFGFCWTRGGQTLGMKAWKIAVVANHRDRPVDWKCAAVRFVAAALSWAALGLGFGWALIDRERRTWHDRISNSHLRNV